MYNSINLPLSPLKVVKKVLQKQPGIIFSLIFVGIFILAFQSSEIKGMENVSSSAVFYGVIIFVAYLILSEIGSIIYEYLYYKYYYYDFREESAEIRKGVITQATGIVRYERIQNIFVDQDFLDRVLGLYDVHYETAGERSQFYSHVDGLDKENSDALVKFLNERVGKGGSFTDTISKGAIPEMPIKPNIQNISGMPIAPELSRANLPMSRDVIKSSMITHFLLLLFLIPFAWPFFGFFFAIPLFLLPAPIALFIGFALVVFFIAVIGFLIYKYNTIWFENYNYVFGNEKGEITSKVIGQSMQYLYYDRIQNINITQGVLDKIWDLYVVAIQTAGEMGMIGMVGLKKNEADKLKNFLLEKAKKYKGL